MNKYIKSILLLLLFFPLMILVFPIAFFLNLYLSIISYHLLIYPSKGGAETLIGSVILWTIAISFAFSSILVIANFNKKRIRFGRLAIYFLIILAIEIISFLILRPLDSITFSEKSWLYFLTGLIPSISLLIAGLICLIIILFFESREKS